MVDQLLKLGADPNLAENAGWTPLHIAAWKWHLKDVELLLGGGANVNQENKLGFTALALAKRSGKTKVVAKLFGRF